MDGESLPNEIKVSSLRPALMHMFGPQAKDLAAQLASEIETCGATTTNMDSSGEAPGLQFREFLHWCRQLRQREIQMYKGMFDEFDADGGGSICVDELHSLVRKLGYTPLRQTIKDFMEQVDDDESGELDFDEFYNLMMLFRHSDGFTKAEVVELDRAFHTYASPETGELSVLPLMDVLHHLGYAVEMDKVRGYVREVDFNGNCTVDFREFLRLMRFHREAELKQVKALFKDMRGESGEMPVSSLANFLTEMGHHFNESALQGILHKMENPTSFGFDSLVDVFDQTRIEFAKERRKHAGFDDQHIGRFHKLFNKLDDDKNGNIEGKELTGLLQELGIQLRSAEDQENVMKKLGTAQKAAADAGVSGDEHGKPCSVTFLEFLHLLRMLRRELNTEEAKVDEEVREETRFSLPEIEDFRAIFKQWAHRCNDGSPQAGKADPIGQAKHKLTCDGVNRVLRSMGATIQREDQKLLEDQFATLQQDDQQTMDFHSFLRLMRWVLDCNFASIKETAEKKGKPTSSS